MAILIDKINCGSGSAGTWFDGCKTTPRDFTKAFLVSPGISVDLVTDTFDQTAISGLIKKGQLVPLNDVLQIAEGGAKNNYQTLPNKKKIFISQGLYEFTLEFEANTCLVKALHALTKKKWGLILLDSEGKFFFDNKAGKLKGFEIQEFSIDNESVNDGGSKIAMVNAVIQLSQDGTKGYNERRSFMLSTDTLDFYSINGVQNVVINPIVKTAAGFKVEVLGGCDNSSPILGLATANFRVKNASTLAVEAVTIVEVGNGQYTVSGATSGAKTIELYDSVKNSNVADILNTQFYSSAVVAVVLT